MADQTIKARIVQKHDTEENWLKATNFIPKQGEFIIYDKDDTYDIERFKIGNGTTNVNELPFQNINISNFKSGSAILIDDVSPVTHEMGVKVRGKNLIPYPYIETTKTQNGITFTDNGDGSITIRGRAEKESYFLLCIADFGDKPISAITADSATNGIYTASKRLYYNNISKVTSINVLSGATVDETIYPQLEIGTTATSYTPYVPDLTAVKVSRCGKNLLSAMSLFPTVTNNAVPIHFKAGQKYTISFTTTYTTWRLMFFGTDKNGTAFDNSSPDANKYISDTYTGTTGRLQHASNQSGNTFTFTCNEDCIINAIVFWNVSNETDKTYSDFQLEFGTTQTDYEPYKECVEYTPTADGTVEGVTSLYPNTTLTTDTDGVLIDCEYLTKSYTEIAGSTNLRNGSAIGSVRSIGSAEESSKYKMGDYAFTEGYFTQASGDYSHAEGLDTTALGPSSHAEGTGTKASCNCSHTEGYNTIASSVNQHVQGRFNIEDKNNTYADIIGNGENPSRLSNAATVDWKGNAWYAGAVYVGSNSGKNKDEGSKKLATEEYVNSAISSSEGSGIVVDTALSSTSTNPVQNKVINTALSNKVDKVSGKGLSTNDYTSADKKKLSGIETEANKTVVDTALSDTSTNPVQNKVVNTALNNKVDKVSGKGLSTNDYTTAEKNKLSGIESGANKTVVDSDLSSTSTNPVQNKVINTALSNKMDKENPTGTGSFSLNRKADTTVGNYSFAEGHNTTAESIASHAEGNNTTALGDYSHAEGNNTVAGQMGFKVTACKKLTDTTGTYTLTSVTGLKVNQRYSVHLRFSREDCGTITAIDTTNKKITVNGYPDFALSSSSSSTANYLTIVSGPKLGDIKVSGDYSHAEGGSTKASGDYSHAEGFVTTALGDYSHAEGGSTTASGDYSHAEGYDTIASGDHEHVQGKYNIKDKVVNRYADIIGNGFMDNEGNIIPSNAATVDWDGYAWYAGAVSSKSADYAEFFEWLDGNPNNEDRVGYLVTLDGEKIRFANPEDEILGIISANPAILGDNYECDWNGKYLTDEFGRILYDKVEEFIDIPKVDEETGETIVEKKSLGFFDHPRINPDYDPDQEYINRRDRSEWAMVGMLGKLFVRDDGTAQINGYVSAGENGIATASVEKTNMRVLSRVNDHIVKVLLK